MANIRKYQPELAELISQEPWAKDGISPLENNLLKAFEILMPELSESLKTISEYQPKLAKALIAQHPWFKPGSSGVLEELVNIERRFYAALYNLKQLSELSSNSKFSYRMTEMKIGESTAYLSIFYEQGINLSVPISRYINGKLVMTEEISLEEIIPQILAVEQAFSGLKRDDLLILTLKLTTERTGTIGGYIAGRQGNLPFITLNHLADRRINAYDLAHELGHFINPFYYSIPIWYDEGSANLLSRVAIEGVDRLENARSVLNGYFEGKKGLKPLDFFMSGDSDSGEAYGRGESLLLNLRNLIGHSAFQAVLQEISSLKDQKFESLMIREAFISNSPENMKSKVGEVYDQAVYGK